LIRDRSAQRRRDSEGGLDKTYFQLQPCSPRSACHPSTSRACGSPKARGQSPRDWSRIGPQAYRDFGNGGGEGVTVSVDGGDYYAEPPPAGGAGTFTIASGGGSGTVDGVHLKGNYGTQVSLSGSCGCR